MAPTGGRSINAPAGGRTECGIWVRPRSSTLPRLPPTKEWGGALASSTARPPRTQYVVADGGGGDARSEAFGRLDRVSADTTGAGVHEYLLPDERCACSTAPATLVRATSGRSHLGHGEARGRSRDSPSARRSARRRYRNATVGRPRAQSDHPRRSTSRRSRRADDADDIEVTRPVRLSSRLILRRLSTYAPCSLPPVGSVASQAGAGHPKTARAHDVPNVELDDAHTYRGPGRNQGRLWFVGSRSVPPSGVAEVS